MKTYRYRGKKENEFNLIESDDLIIVRTKENWDPLAWLIKQVHELAIDHIKEIDTYPEASVYVYKLLHDVSKDVRDDFKKKVKAKKNNRIVFIGTVFTNQFGSYQIYTGNLFIQFTSSISVKKQYAILEKHGLKNKEAPYLGEGSYFIEPHKDAGRDIFELSLELLELPEVSLCHPELVVARKTIEYKKAAVPDGDPDWALRQIEVEKAWKRTKGKGVKICIIDDGIDLEHPAFKDYKKVTITADMFGDKDTPATHKFPSEMHGTACASIACSSDPVAKGVAPDSILMVVRTKGLGSVMEAEAIRWAVDNDADIISCSWGPSDGAINNPNDDYIKYALPDHTKLALEHAAKKGRGGKGCFIFFAAGNGKEPVANDGYASNPYVMAIGAVNKEGKLTGYSDRGDPLFCCFPSSEIIAQGQHFVHIYGLMAADRVGEAGYAEGNYFSSFGGTSASCPGMAGIAALMLSINPALTLEQGKSILASACKMPSGISTADHELYGHGVINARRVVELSQSSLNQKSINMRNISFSRYSLHIALNKVSVDYYGQAYPLEGCHNDAEYYHSLCEGFDRRKMLFDSEATRNGVIREIEALIQSAVAGDYVFITYAGHGSLVDDKSGDEDDEFGKDETLVLYDGFWIDDEINNLLCKFEKGVNLIWVSDSCHSGSNTRMVLTDDASSDIKPRFINHAEAQRVFDANRAFYENELDKLPTRFFWKKKKKMKANLLTLAAVEDNQLAGDLPENGLFTGKLKELFSATPGISYNDIMTKAQQTLPANRQPVLSERPEPHGLKDEPFFLPKGTNKSYKSESNKSSKEQAIPRVLVGNELIIEGLEADSKLELKSRKSGRSMSSESVRLVNSTISSRAMNNVNAWDEAYNVFFQIKDEKLNYVEPDITSAINADPATINERGGKYLPTYPDPETRGNPQPIVWHLDEDHSQLRSAFKKATRNEAQQGGLTDTTKNSFPLIAHIDTGVFPHHPTLPENFLAEESEAFSNYRDEPDFWMPDKVEQQGHGHGTISLLAGGKLTKSQTQSNYKGYMGAFPWARVAALKISETVVILSGRKFAKALRYAVDVLKADVVTMSMAGTPTLKMLDAINYAYDNGVVVVSAGGNSWHKGVETAFSDELMYPARFHRVIGVTGATYDDTPYLVEYNEDWKSRNEGDPDMQTCYGPAKAMKTIMAAYTPNIFWAGKKADQGLFRLKGGGTSSATPQVAAAAALWLHYHKNELDAYDGEPWKRVEAVRKALFDSAHKVHANVFGNGVLRAKDALKIKPDKAYLDALKETPEDSLEHGWFKGLIKMFDPFRSSDRQRRLSAMLHTEIEQVRLIDPDLKKFQTEKKASAKLKIAIIKSPYASRTLKEILSADKEVINLISKKKSVRSLDMPLYCKRLKLTKKKSDNAHTLLITSAQPLDNISFKRNKDRQDAFAGTIKIKASKNRALDSDLKIRLAANDEYAYLICETDTNGVKHYSWNYPGLIRKKNDRSLLSQNEYGILELNYGDGRNIFKKIKSAVIWVMRLARKEALSELSGLVYCRPLENDCWKEVTSDIRAEVKKQKKTLFLSHGILSSTEGAFEHLIKNDKFKSYLSRKNYGSIVLGYNMPTLRTSIDTNVTAIRGSLNGLNLKQQDLTVIGHSRGCLVARKLFANYNNVKMILNAGPHLGTPMAHEDFIPEFLDSLTSMIISVAGKKAPAIKLIPEALADFVFKRVELSGLTDMMVGSKFLTHLNDTHKMKRQVHTVIGVNYNASGFKKCVDNIWDSKVFEDKDNDIAVPYNSALSEDVGDPVRIRTYKDSRTHHISMFKDAGIINDIVNKL